MSIYNSNNRINRKRKDETVNKNNMFPLRKREKQKQSHIQKEANNANIASIAGNWIIAVGVIVSAIGSTPSKVFSEQTLTDFNLIGNVLEAGGTAIAAKGEEGLLNIVGDQIQAIGNIAVIAGILNNNEQSGELLQKQGDLLQIVGMGMTIQTSGRLTLLETIENTGNIIQLIGNVIQVFANTDTEEGAVMNAVGAWIQAIGAIITALATE
ncbi:hypothetical protein LZ480_15000 [Solibacillus sp. MA9]|uniref:Uncharacterized protein n=1 Tax=Solibacillus palustris TaxID=2908203 RepID=A0ABS9UGU8_9BACL|nr:hypothetical protein [Solibacillus sp. MA9]MCH7323183.1 hypothetical protein [Solibacillus sp. MA9]